MSDEIEPQIRSTLASDVRDAPPISGLAAATLHRSARRRRVRIAAGAATTVVVLAAAAIGLASNEFIGGTQEGQTVAAGPSSTRHPLPDSGWPESRIAIHVRQSGELQATEEGCFYLDRGPEIGPLGLLWPQGWTWTEGEDGVLQVFNSSGDYVMRPGDTISFGGGYSPEGDTRDDICGLGVGAWFPMNSEPQVEP